MSAETRKIEGPQVGDRVRLNYGQRFEGTIKTIHGDPETMIVSDYGVALDEWGGQIILASKDQVEPIIHK